MALANGIQLTANDTTLYCRLPDRFIINGRDVHGENDAFLFILSPADETSLRRLCLAHLLQKVGGTYIHPAYAKEAWDE